MGRFNTLRLMETITHLSKKINQIFLFKYQKQPIFIIAN